MKTVLFAYEFGAGLGHLNRLIAVAKRLPESCRLVFAVPDLALGVPVLRRTLGERIDVRQGVTWAPIPRPNIRAVPTLTFADVIRLFGFHEVERLRAAVGQADALLQAIDPDLIISDFAPTLRLAAFGSVPTIVVGNGYTVPPPARALPSMRPWSPTVPNESRRHEAELLATVNTTQQGRGRPAVDHFADLFQGEATFVCTLAEFDPYGSYRKRDVLWPFNIPAIEPGPAFDQRGGAPVFSYFQADHPALKPLLAALGAGSARSEIFVQGADPHKLAASCTRQVGIHTKPADFSRVLPQASLLVHHGGLGTAYAGLMAGVPQLVLPLNLEHLITSAGLTRFETGVIQRAVPTPNAGDIKGLIREAQADGRLRRAALSAARALELRRDPNSVAKVISCCASYLA